MSALAGPGGRQTFDCGCWIDSIQQVRCPLHNVAPELLALLKDVLHHPDLVKDFEHIDRGVGAGTQFGVILLRARKVIAKAEGHV